MQLITINKLLELVKRNYQEIAADFNATRQKEIWPEIKSLAEKIKSNSRILDLGCGNGRLLEVFKNKPIDYLGIDNSYNLVELARKNYPGHQFLVGDILKLSDFFNSFIGQSDDLVAAEKIKKYDYIFCLAVLQHIPGIDLRIQALRDMKEHLKDQGQVVISVWNLWSPVWKTKGYRQLIFKEYLLKLVGRQDLDFGDLVFPWKNAQGRIVSERYYHAFTARELKKIAVRAGFKKIDLKKDKFNYWLVLG